ncbi:MAG: ribosomal protein L23 [Parcubacteria bacterium C7867-004]|nr:MAG: ribosomal protein L23 [Parcubacteria bacterium C7867-004]
MALFSNDKKEVKAKKPKSTTRNWGRGVLAADDARLANVLKRPWFSEKALIGTESGVYVFEVAESATKLDVANAVMKAYNVTPAKVRMTNLPAKSVSLRTRRGQGTRSRRHKAYVYLKKGDTIQFA